MYDKYKYKFIFINSGIPMQQFSIWLVFFQNLRQPYTNAAEDVDENGEAVHCTKYLQTAFWLRIGKSE